MSSLRIVFLLLALLSGGLAHAASHPFDNVPRASDEELDSMRGGFVVNWNGREFLMPFSIDGIERLTQINGQTFINGALVSPRVNPQALIPFTQLGQVSVNMPALPPISGPSAGVSQAETGTTGTPPLAQTASGPDANRPTSLPATQATQSSGSLDTTTTPSTSTNTNTANTQVTMQGSLIVIQNGAANSIVVPSGTSLDSLATIIQNSVNDQVIRNITTMNITIDTKMLAAQAQLNAILNQHGLR
jgi:hypothetical protein